MAWMREADEQRTRQCSGAACSWLLQRLPPQGGGGVWCGGWWSVDPATARLALAAIQPAAAAAGHDVRMRAVLGHPA
jgi:hypothetical protein